MSNCVRVIVKPNLPLTGRKPYSSGLGDTGGTPGTTRGFGCVILVFLLFRRGVNYPLRSFALYIVPACRDAGYAPSARRALLVRVAQQPPPSAHLRMGCVLRLVSTRRVERFHQLQACTFNGYAGYMRPKPAFVRQIRHPTKDVLNVAHCNLDTNPKPALEMLAINSPSFAEISCVTFLDFKRMYGQIPSQFNPLFPGYLRNYRELFAALEPDVDRTNAATASCPASVGGFDSTPSHAVPKRPRTSCSKRLEFYIASRLGLEHVSASDDRKYVDPSAGLSAVDYAGLFAKETPSPPVGSSPELVQRATIFYRSEHEAYLRLNGHPTRHHQKAKKVVFPQTQCANMIFKFKGVSAKYIHGKHLE
ncbi:hypothetical protein C8R46DRAFT_1027887 [Mycena filopes]|nr:hypothetical protein C8R46DRAFT_1027887 [Mycena filopes]